MELSLNKQPVEVDEPADKTVLQFVRERGLTGSKEGCASGDCGACTVMVGEFVDGRARYQTINSCITPIGQLAGKHLVTVEGLAHNSALHPAQEQMVLCHGSQCGFCTPGFVMSLANMVETGEAATQGGVLQGISGNLANGSPIADMPPVLIAWDAQLELVKASGASRMMSVPDFYTGYRRTVLGEDEYIARIHIPKTSIDRFHQFYKSSKRIEDDISSVMGAFSFSGHAGYIDEARVSFGGMAATPVRIEAVEKALQNRQPGDDLIADVCEQLDREMTPLTDVRASAGYRMAMAKSMLERALRVFRGESQPLVTELHLDV